MALAAAQVVDAIAARLAGTATLVTTKRMHPLDEASLPAWKVLPGVENIDSNAADIEAHELGVECHGFVRAVDNVDDALHALTAAGLTAIHGTQAATFTVRTDSITRRITNAEGEAAVASVLVRLLCNFHTAPSAPETLL